MNWNSRRDCTCVICRTGSVFAYGVAMYCCHFYNTLPVCTCQCESNLSTFEVVLGPHIPSTTFLEIARYVLSKEQFISYSWHIPFRQQRSIDMPPIDYLFGFFQLSDQFLDIPTSVWIHFVWLLNRVCAKYRHMVCSHTFIPLVWMTLTVMSKFYDDHHFVNRAFVKVINHCFANTNSTTTPFNNNRYRNPYFLTRSLVPVTYITLGEFNLLEQLLLVDMLQFHLLSLHDCSNWPLFTCWCLECQPFHAIYAECSTFIHQYPVKMFRRRCAINNEPYVQEYKEFIEMFYLRLRQTNGVHMEKITNDHNGSSNHNYLPTILKRSRKRTNQFTPNLFTTETETELVNVHV